MKKVIESLGVAMVVVAMIINVNISELSSNKSEMNLASLIAMNISNAEGGNRLASNCVYSGDTNDSCKDGVITLSECKKKTPPYAANCYY